MISLHQLLYWLRRDTEIVHVETEINLAVKPAECLVKVGLPAQHEQAFRRWLKDVGVNTDRIMYEIPARDWMRFYFPVAIEGE